MNWEHHILLFSFTEYSYVFADMRKFKERKKLGFANPHYVRKSSVTFAEGPQI